MCVPHHDSFMNYGWNRQVDYDSFGLSNRATPAAPTADPAVLALQTAYLADGCAARSTADAAPYRDHIYRRWLEARRHAP